jgi:hypothetical protein
VFKCQLETKDGQLTEQAVAKAMGSREKSRQCPFKWYEWTKDGTLLIYWKRKETEKKAVYSFVRSHLVKELKLSAWVVERSHCPVIGEDVD